MQAANKTTGAGLDDVSKAKADFGVCKQSTISCLVFNMVCAFFPVAKEDLIELVKKYKSRKFDDDIEGFNELNLGSKC